MYKFQHVTKSGLLSLVAAAPMSFTGVPLASASSYTYNLTSLSGSITTNCDNCVLNSSDITGWSMSVPGFVSLASTTPGAKLFVPAGDTGIDTRGSFQPADQGARSPSPCSPMRCVR